MARLERLRRAQIPVPSSRDVSEEVRIAGPISQRPEDGLGIYHDGKLWKRGKNALSQMIYQGIQEEKKEKESQVHS